MHEEGSLTGTLPCKLWDRGVREAFSFVVLQRLVFMRFFLMSCHGVYVTGC